MPYTNLIIYTSPAESTLSDDEDGAGEGGEDGTALCYAFPALDTQIRACVREYGGVFPKLNFSAPKVRPIYPAAPWACV